MGEINWGLLGGGVDTTAQVQQGFATGAAMVKQVQTRNALRAYLANPDDPSAYNALAFYDPQAAASMQQQRMLLRKEAQSAQELATRKQAGALYAAGDTAGASRTLFGAGDFETGKAVNDAAAAAAKDARGLQDEELKRSAAFWDKAGPLALQLKDYAGNPQKQRELYDAARPILEATGAKPELINSFDPTNPAQIEAALTTAQTVAQEIEQRKVVWHQQGEQPSFATDAMGRPIGSQNPYASGARPAAASSGGFDAAVDHVLSNEGGYNASDMNGKPVNFGINQGANPDVDVKNLTRDKAKQIYLERYWKPSGAENLPANMQAPYFDVYIRNPKIAKQALTDSNGDPHRFMELSSGYFQGLARTPEGQKYGRAWASRDAKNTAIAVGTTTTDRHPISKAEFDRLPSGSEFIAPDGTRRIKP